MSQVTSMKTKSYSVDSWATYRGLKFGTQVEFGNHLRGEVVATCFRGPSAEPIYVVQWWEMESGLNEIELYEQQLRVVEK